MNRTIFGWISLFLAVPVVGFAQASPNGAPVKDWSIETVVVTAQASGPAFWHVSKGRSDLWILGIVEPVPTDLKWDSRELDKLIDHARVVLLPPRGRVGIFEGIWFLITSGDVLRLSDGQKLESVLAEPMNGRFARARAEAHRDADHFAEYKPSVAGFMLEGDFLEAAKLTLREPQATVRLLAARKNVRVHTIATYPALDVVKEVSSLSQDGNLECLKDSLDDIDIMNAHAKLAAQAWAVGDVDGIKAHYSEPRALDCLGQSVSFTRLWQQSVDDTVGAVDAALKRPGKTLILINMGEFLRKNGVLERLKAQGLQLEGPATND